MRAQGYKKEPGLVTNSNSALQYNCTHLTGMCTCKCMKQKCVCVGNVIQNKKCDKHREITSTKGFLSRMYKYTHTHVSDDTSRIEHKTTNTTQKHFHPPLNITSVAVPKLDFVVWVSYACICSSLCMCMRMCMFMRMCLVYVHARVYSCVHVYFHVYAYPYMYIGRTIMALAVRIRKRNQSKLNSIGAEI